MAGERSGASRIRDGPIADLLSPLAGGALAGADVMNRSYSGVKRWGLPFDYTAEQKQAAAQVRELAQQWGHRPAHLALGWLLSRPQVAAAVIGPETPDELAENLGALDVRLEPAQLEQLDPVGRTPPSLPL